MLKVATKRISNLEDENKKLLSAAGAGRLDRAIEDCCDELPAGWEVSLNIKDGNAIVILRNPLGNLVYGGRFFSETLPEQIQNALKCAIHQNALDSPHGSL